MFDTAPSLVCLMCLFFFFKQKTAYEMRISDWSSDVCSSDLGTTSGNKAMSLDVFRLMRATGSLLNRNEVAEYAALATEGALPGEAVSVIREDRKSTRLNSSH